MSQVAVLGAGSWGTALALQLARAGQRVKLWGHRAEHMAQLRADGENRRYLGGIPFPPNLEPVVDLQSALTGSAFILLVVPSHVFVETLERLRALNVAQPIFWAIKGFFNGQPLSHSFRERLPHNGFGVIAGPSFAKEVALGRPTAITVASADEDLARTFAERLHGQNFLCYTTTDLIGVQIGGAVKNVIAIATGIADGLGLGANTRAALITRGLREIRRLNQVLGGQEETLMGLAGLGDLVLTCTDEQSRNRRFGYQLGLGGSASAAKALINQVVEGEHTTHETWTMAQHYGVHMPITEHLHRLLTGQWDLQRTLQSLLARAVKAENQ